MRIYMNIKSQRKFGTSCVGIYLVKLFFTKIQDNKLFSLKKTNCLTERLNQHIHIPTYYSEALFSHLHRTQISQVLTNEKNI